MFTARTLVAAWLSVAGALWTAPELASGQTPDQSHGAIHDGAPPSNQASNSPPRRVANPSQADGDTPDDSPDLLVVGAAASFVTFLPFGIPHSALDDDFSRPEYFLRYPYWHDEPGAIFAVPAYGARQRTWQTEWAFEFADNFDDLDRIGGRFRLSTTSRLDLEANWNTLDERTFQGRDHVTLGDVDVLLRFAQSEQLQFRSGLGANWFDDHQGAVAGFNFRYGADWYPCRPWHLAASFDVGEVGKAGLAHVRTTAGLTYSRWELYTGWDYRVVGSVHFGGPLAGLQFRF